MRSRFSLALVISLPMRSSSFSMSTNSARGRYMVASWVDTVTMPLRSWGVWVPTSTSLA